MAPTVVHVIDSPVPSAGCVHGHVPGLVASLGAHGFGGRLIAVETSGQLSAWTGNGGGPGTWQSCTADELQHTVAEAALIHVHGLAPLQHPLLRAAAGRRSPPVLVAPYAALIDHPWRRQGLLQRLRQWMRPRSRLGKHVAALLAANEEEAQALRSLHDQVHVVPAGIDAQPPPAGDPAWLAAQLGGALGQRCALYLGPIHPLEGLVPLLKACEVAVLGAPDWHLILAGSVCGSWLKMIRPAVERRRLSDRVTFVLNPELVQQHDLLRQCELVIQPSLLPAPPWSAQCGLLHGKPCVVSSRCHLFDGPADWAWQAVPQKHHLGEILQSVLTGTPDDHRARGSSGRRWLLENRAWSVLAPRYAGLYRQSCALAGS